MSGEEAKTRAMALIHKAGLAPSSHNTQPWRFRISPLAIDLYADPGRALPVNDPQERELVISCGCALMNLRVAAAAAGLAGRVVRFPDPEQPRWLARLVLDGKAVSREEAVLAPFIEQRRTCRRGFLPRAVDAPVLGRLMDAARTEGASLRPLGAGETRARVAALVAEGDARQWANSDWCCELAAWVGPRRRREGLTVPAPAAPIIRWVVRRLDLGARVGARDRTLASSAPLLVVLGTPGDRHPDWLLAGQALQRLLLVACRYGLQASYLNQPVQVPALRDELQGVAGGGTALGGVPQLLLCLGRPGSALAPTPRRGVMALLDEAQPQPQPEPQGVSA